MAPNRSPLLKPEDYFLEVLKIVNGALSGDRAKVVTYVEKLAEKLESGGAERAAAKLRRSLAEHPSVSYTSGFPEAGHVPVDSESRLPLADQEILELDAASVFLDPVVRQRLDEFLRFTQSANQLLAHGVGIAPSMLVYGPPGCGKTEIARFISAQLRLPLLTARSDSLISSFLGSTAKNLRLLFESAMRRPCVLFLDEFDALAKKRDDQNELGELKRVVISLLQNLDALDGKTVVVAATNHEHLLDPAVWRRFSYRLEVNPPAISTRAKIFARYLSDFAPPEGVDLLAELSDGLTGADIKGASEDSIRQAILEGASTVPLDSVMRRVLRNRLGQSFSWLPTAENIREVRHLSEDIFTYRRIASLFDVSLGKISRFLSEEEHEHGQDAAAN
jgi:SpoVK/Ycf46/Vps4 family AAA+-type ATPase